MMHPKDPFHCVRERAVTDVVQESGGPGRSAISRRDVAMVTQLLDNSSHQVKRSQAVCESRVLSALIGIESETELFDASQSLKFGRIDQPNHQLFRCTFVAQWDDVMNRIAINSLGHRSSYILRKQAKVYHDPIQPLPVGELKAVRFRRPNDVNCDREQTRQQPRILTGRLPLSPGASNVQTDFITKLCFTEFRTKTEFLDLWRLE